MSVSAKHAIFSHFYQRFATKPQVYNSGVVRFRASSCTDCFLWVWKIAHACLASEDIFAFYVAKPGCNARFSLSCIDEGTLRIFTLGIIEVETSRDENLCHVQAK